MDQADRRLAWNEDQLLPFFQHDVGGAEQGVVAGAVRDPPERAHAARDDDHDIQRIGAAGEAHVHAGAAVALHAFGHAQSSGEFLGDDGFGVFAQDHMDLVFPGIKVVQEALGVERAAGSGDGDKDSQIGSFGWLEYGRAGRRQQVGPEELPPVIRRISLKPCFANPSPDAVGLSGWGWACRP